MIQTTSRDQALDTTPSYTKTLRIQATPHSLYAAVTTASGIKGWWSADTTGENGEITVRFGGRNFQTLRLVDLIPDKQVVWEWIAQYFPVEGTTQTDEWVGTRVSFDIQPNPDGFSTLVFTHIGLTPHLDCYDLCIPGWNFYLGSLTHYLEDGAGSPYIPEA